MAKAKATGKVSTTGTVGYSGTPLPQKLGIKEGHKVVLVGAPAGFDLGTVPAGATIATRASGSEYDVLVVFVRKRDDLIKQLASLRPKMAQAGGLWIAWPKRASGVPTDIVEDTIREVALPTGLVDNKVCAIDETWSGLRLVIRKQNRTK
jgi:hypothetical protein